MTRLSLALVTAGLIGFTAGQASAATQLSRQDQNFIRQASQTNLAEINEGHLAVDKGGSETVKQLGQTLITDHTQAEDQLRQIAQQQGFQVPQSPSRRQESQANNLSRESGARFDRTFANDEVKGHERAITAFRKEARSSRDPALRSYAETTVPVLEKHLKMAQMAVRGG